MANTFLSILLHALEEGRLIHNLSYILVHKRLFGDVLCGSQTKALLLGLNDVDVDVLPAVETLIATKLSPSTLGGRAFDLGHAVDTARFVRAGEIFALGVRVAIAEHVVVKLARRTSKLLVVVVVECDLLES